VLGAAIGMVAFKCLLNVLAGLANRWSVPGSIQLGFLLGQGGEFTLVLFAFPAVSGMVDPDLLAILVSAIAISLALTPMVSNIGRKLAGKLRQGPPDQKIAGDDAPVVIIGLGPAGRAVADALTLHEVKYLAVEADMERFEKAIADGYHVQHAEAGNPRSWDAMGMAKRELVVISTGNHELSRELTPLVEERLPGVTRIAALRSPEGIASFGELGIPAVDVAADGGIDTLIEAVFERLGIVRARQAPPLLEAAA